MDISAFLNMAAAGGGASIPFRDVSAESGDVTFSDQLVNFMTATGNDFPGLPDTASLEDHAETDPVADMVSVLTGITASVSASPDAIPLTPGTRPIQDAAAQTTPELQDEIALHSTRRHQPDPGVVTAVPEHRIAPSDGLPPYVDRPSPPVTANRPTIAPEEIRTRTAGDTRVRTTWAEIPPQYVATPSRSPRTPVPPQAEGVHAPAVSTGTARDTDETASPLPKAGDLSPEPDAAVGLSSHPKSGDRGARLAQPPRKIAAETVSPGSGNIKTDGEVSIRVRTLPFSAGNSAAPLTEPASATAPISGHIDSGHFELQGDGIASPPRPASVDGPPGHTGISPQAEARGTSSNPLSVIRQIADAVVTTRNETVEITLSPEELGRVRMILTGHERAPHLAIWAERPEILEQMRRNADLLMQQFGEEGLPDATLSFQDHRQHGDTINDDPTSGNENTNSPPDADPALTTGGSIGRDAPRTTGTHRLDVRM